MQQIILSQYTPVRNSQSNLNLKPQIYYDLMTHSHILISNLTMYICLRFFGLSNNYCNQIFVFEYALCFALIIIASTGIKPWVTLSRKTFTRNANLILERRNYKNMITYDSRIILFCLCISLNKTKSERK
jgi:hypothetical protein